MSEFKFACPVCGQHIKCDSTQSGTTLECPTCFQKVVVPQAPASSDPKFILTGTKVSERPVPAAAAAGPESPGPAKKSLAAPILFVVFVLVCAGAAVLYATHEKQSQPTKATGRSAAGETDNPVDAPALPAAVVVDDANWMLDLTNAVFPEATACGRIHGRPFMSQRAILEGGTLTLRYPARDTTRLGLSIYLYATRSVDLAGQSVNISSDSTNAPRVRLRWRDEGATQNETQDFKQGYALRVEFGPLAGKRLGGKLYLCTPDEAKSYVAGTFDAEIRAPKPTKP